MIKNKVKIVAGSLMIVKRKARLNSLYLNVTVSILIVFLVCMGSLTGAYQFNFNGAFFFLHVVNPIVYGFMKAEELTLVCAIITGIVIYAFLYLFSLILFFLNRLAHKNKWHSPVEDMDEN